MPQQNMKNSAPGNSPWIRWLRFGLIMFLVPLLMSWCTASVINWVLMPKIDDNLHAYLMVQEGMLSGRNDAIYAKSSQATVIASDPELKQFHWESRKSQ